MHRFDRMTLVDFESDIFQYKWGIVVSLNGICVPLYLLMGIYTTKCMYSIYVKITSGMCVARELFTKNYDFSYFGLKFVNDVFILCRIYVPSHANRERYVAY
jgi:hypothetical protein